MIRLAAAAALSVLAFARALPACAQSEKLSGTRAALEADNSSGGMTALPPLPSGTSTIFGGAIRHIDPVRDQILLDVYGERPMKILFDERTQLYRDGVKIPLHDLKPVEHASVQTALDGSGIFAMSIHILSEAPKGDFRGRVVRFERSTGVLELEATPSPPFTVVVANNATFVRKGQSAFTSQPTRPAGLEAGLTGYGDVFFRRGGPRCGQRDRRVGCARGIFRLQRHDLRARHGHRLNDHRRPARRRELRALFLSAPGCRSPGIAHGKARQCNCELRRLSVRGTKHPGVLIPVETCRTGSNSG